ncbi:MAG TPA: DUF2235 domain-containing protein [Methylocystis sp.]|nr:DUF2235 domain-containing protein [Methylocystis sp.]
MKRLIVCCDGTWNSADSKNAETNVALIARAIHANPEGGPQQVVLYLRGVGSAGLVAETLWEGATGYGIDENIRSAYMFIAQNYVPGDEIFLFGFSRGAFTARSLAGFISACGILKRQKLGDLLAAWDYYRDARTAPHSPAAFIESCHTDCHLDAEIKFLGVWDTVGALGIPGQLLAADNEKKFAFHDTGPCPIVKHARHALAIDEHRDQFVPTLWTGTPPAGVDIEQVWFAGAHSDVGGGYVTRALADTPLVWMAKEAEDKGLSLDWSCLPDPEKLDPRAPLHDSRTSVFTFDRLRPTLREIAETPCEVSFYERLYAPIGPDGNALLTINQAIHRSVITRYGEKAAFCTDDNAGAQEEQVYGARNLAPFFDQNGKYKGKPPIAE